MSEFLGLTRERLYSPGKVEADAAVLNAVALELQRNGREATVWDADREPWPIPKSGSLVFAMAQGPAALARMAEWQRQGIRVINSPEAILNCHRHRTVPLLLAEPQAHFPPTVLVETGADVALPEWTRDQVWIKRGDVHATDPADVTAVQGTSAVAAALDKFRKRGIARAAVQQHIPGRVVKFYGVRGRFFFPVLDGQAVPSEQLAALESAAAAAAVALGVEVFGGDGVCSRDGSVRIIDLNDWPSYTACRAAAAASIAHYLIAQKDSPT